MGGYKMTKPTNERMKILHEKLEKYKDDILKDKAEDMSNMGLARKYGINRGTMAGWVRFWQTGVNIQKQRRKRFRKRKVIDEKRVFSKQLKTQMKINSEINKRLIKRVNINNGDDERMIRYICGVKV
jgi:transposase